MQVNINNILKVYNGRCGCMCGCQGKYSYTKINQDLATQDRGYTVSDDECSDRSVKIIARKVLSNPNVKFEDNYAYVEDRANNKMQVVYFNSPEVMPA